MFLLTDKSKISFTKLVNLFATVTTLALQAVTATAVTLTGTLTAAAATVSGLVSAGSLKVGGVPMWIPVIKTADETLNTNTTLQDDDALLFAVAANTKYRFRFVVFYDTPTAADFKWQLTGPAAATLIIYDASALAPGATSVVITRDSAFSSAHSLTETSGTPGSVKIDGILQNGANAGSIKLQWAQNTSNGSNTTVRAGSYVEYSAVS